MAFTLFNILLSPIIFLLLLFVVSSRMKPALLSPTYGLVVLYTGMFLFGPFAYDPNYKGASIRIDISPLDVMVILPAVFWMLCAFLAGVLVFSMVAPSGPTLKRNVREFHPVELTTRRSIYILMFSVGAVGLEIYAEGLSGLWFRHTYFTDMENAKVLFTAARALMFTSLPMLGLVDGQVGASAGLKRIARLTLLAAILIYLGESTRQVAFAPLLFFLGKFLANPSHRKGQRRIVIAAVVMPALIAFPIAARESPDQGIAAIPQNALSLLGLEPSAGEAAQGGYRVILNNIFISVPITKATMEYSSGNDTDYVLNAINPMPSAVADLGGIDLMRLNAYTPLNAVGDLIRAGLFFGMSYYFVVGIFFASLEANLRFESGPTILRVGQLGLVFVFALETLQYPLRNVTRLLYYSLAIGLAMRLFTLLKAKRSKRVKSRADGGALPGKVVPTFRPVRFKGTDYLPPTKLGDR